MSFFSGLKRLFKQKIYIILIFAFVIAWFLIFLGRTYPSYQAFNQYVYSFILFLLIFSLLLMILSIFRPLKLMKWYEYFAICLIALISFIPMFNEFFMDITLYLLPFSVIANQLLTAFFAFKFCFDVSTSVDDYLENKEAIKRSSRIFEFFSFAIIDAIALIIARRFFFTSFPQTSNIFFIILWVNLILVGFVIVRLVLTKKFAAYIPLFLFLAFFYILYILVSLIADILFLNTNDFFLLSFFIDILLFLVIIGSLFDKIEYIETKIKIIHPGSIALFILIVKLMVQITEIIPNITDVINYPQITDIIISFFYDYGLLGIFIGFTFLFGLISIISKRVKKF